MNPIELFRMMTTPPLRRLAPDADDIRAARRLHQLARRERDLGRVERAEELAMRALRTLEQYASTSHPEVTAVLTTLVGIRAMREAKLSA
jgi:hypothetical protein